MIFIYDFFLYTIASLIGSWLWDFWTKRTAAKENEIRKIKSCIEKITHCLHELDYNSTHGIGGPNCRYITEAQQKLLYSEEVFLLGDDIKESLKMLIIDAGKANGYPFSTAPGIVKKGNKLLRELLQKRKEELKATEKSK